MKYGILIPAVLLAGCATKHELDNLPPAKPHHTVHKAVAVPVAAPAAAPVVQVAPPPVVPAPVVAPAPQKHGALRWFLRDRSTSGGK
jgi:hypothetical protein